MELTEENMIMYSCELTCARSAFSSLWEAHTYTTTGWKGLAWAAPVRSLGFALPFAAWWLPGFRQGSFFVLMPEDLRILMLLWIWSAPVSYLLKDKTGSAITLKQQSPSRLSRLGKLAGVPWWKWTKSVLASLYPGLRRGTETWFWRPLNQLSKEKTRPDVNHKDSQ